MTEGSDRPPRPAVDPRDITAAHAPGAAGGRIWRLPDDVDTDALAPGQVMSRGLEVIAGHCLARVRTEFAEQVRAGDLIVAGERFGIGSSREQAAAVLRHLGVAAVIAPSFAGLFHRNAINLGLAVLVCREAGRLADGERARLDLDAARLEPAEGPPIACEPLPGFLREILAHGGLLPMLRARLARERDGVNAPGTGK